MKKTFVRLQLNDRNLWSISPEHYQDILQPKTEDKCSSPKKRRRSSTMSDDSLPDSPKRKAPRSLKARGRTLSSTPESAGSMLGTNARRGISKAEASPAVVPCLSSVAVALSFSNDDFERGLEELWLPAMPSTDPLIRADANCFPACRATPFQSLEDPYLESIMSWDWDLPTICHSE